MQMNSSDRREIFFVIGSLNVGGAEMHLSHIAPELVKLGYSVSIYNLTGDGALAKTLAARGVTVIAPPVRSATDAHMLIKLPILCLSALKLFLIFLFKRPRTVHFFLPQAYIVGAIMARIAGLNCLVMSRRSLNEYQRRHPILGKLERHLHRSMTAILGNSQCVTKQLHEEENVPEDRLGILYNGVQLDAFKTVMDAGKKRKSLGLPRDAKVFIKVANLIAYKGHEDLLLALDRIRGELPQDWRLLVVGRDDGIGEQIQRLVHEKKLDEHVRFLGSRRDIPELLRASEIGILCSHQEGFSNAILEAMAAGLPMVATNVGGNAEAVEDGKTGLLVPPHDPAALGAAILRIAGDEQLAKKLGENAKLRAYKHFSLAACVSAYDALYSSLEAEHGIPESLKWQPR